MTVLELYSLGVTPILGAVSVSFVVLGVTLLRSRHPPGVLALALSVFAAAIWSGGAAGEVLAADSASVVVLIRSFKYIGVCLIPPLFLTFVVRYALGKTIPAVGLVALFALPVLSILMVWTNPLHELMYAHPPRHPALGGPRDPWGPWFTWVHLPVLYGFVAAAWALLGLQVVRGNAIRRAQAAVLLLGSLPPAAVNLVYVLNRDVPNLQLTSLAFAATAVIWGWGLVRFRLFKVSPLALRAVFDAVGDAVLLVDAEDRLADVNPAGRRLLGLEGMTEVLGLEIGPILERAGLEGELPVPAAPAEMWTDDGRHLEVETHAIRNGRNAEIRGRVVVLRDVTLRRRSEAALRESDALMRSVIDLSPIGIVRLRPVRDSSERVRDFVCLMANPTTHRYLATRGEPLKGRTLTDVRPPHTPLFIDTLRHVSNSRDPAEFTVQVEVGPNESRWFRINAVPVAEDVSVTFIDVTRERSRQMAMEAVANHDALTGLLNRRGLEEDARMILESAARDGRETGLLYMDLDRFKHVNDRLGHRAGDQILATFAERLLDCVRAEDLVGRVGGDEFVALIQEGDRLRVAEVAERIRAVGAEPYPIGRYQVSTPPSVGVALSPRDGTSWDDLLSVADANMYRAKGRASIN